jgi:tripartite-type tricarboxylate transporter receptor subunit TctC
LSAISIFCFAITNAPTALDARAADSYPDRPIHLLVAPYPPSGPNDVIARLVANKLGDGLGWHVVVENRPGGSGNLAVIGTAVRLNPSLFSNVGYAFDQFTPVSIPTQDPQILVVHPSLGTKSAQELVERAKKEPGKINSGSSGNGTSVPLAAELFKRAAGVDLQHVPYKGTSVLMADLLAGRVPVAFVSLLVAKQHVARGELLARNHLQGAIAEFGRTH